MIIRGTDILYYKGLRIQVTNNDFALESNFYDYVNAMAGYLENIKLRPLWNCPIVASFNPLKKIKVRIQISSYNTAPQFLGYTVLLDFSSKLRKLIINFVINNTNIFTDTCNMEKEHFIFIQISFYEKIKHSFSSGFQILWAKSTYWQVFQTIPCPLFRLVFVKK